MSEVIVCAEPESQREAAEFIEGLGGHPQAFSARALRLSRHGKRLLVYVKRSQRSGALKSRLRRIPTDRKLSVVVYSIDADENRAAELGRIVGECRPKRTRICFDAATVREIFQLGPGSGKTGAAVTAISGATQDIATLRKRLLLTQVDLAKSLGVSERTVQNWETGDSIPDERQFRDLRELDALLTRYVPKNRVSTWMNSASDAFHHHSPRELILEGKTRDIIIEFRRMQRGEPL